MNDYIACKQNLDGSIENESNRCPQCDSQTRRFGRNGAIDIECATCGVIASTRDQTILADGGQTAYDILSRFNDPEGHSDRLQQYLDGDLTANDLTPADIIEPLKLALGQLCLEVDHEYKTEWIFVTDDGFASKTRFETNRSDWGPISVDENAIQARLHRGKTLTVRLTERADVRPPKNALDSAPEVPA